MSTNDTSGKKKLSAGGMAFQLVGNFLIWQLILYIPYIALGGVVFWLLKDVIAMKSAGLFTVLCAISLTIVNGLYEFVTWKLSTRQAFRRNTITADKLRGVMIYLFVAMVVICVSSCLSNIKTTRQDIKEAVETELGIEEISIRINSGYYSVEDIATFEKLKQEVIDKGKRDVTVFMIIFSALDLAICMGILLLVEKAIRKYVDADTGVQPMEALYK